MDEDEFWDAIRLLDRGCGGDDVVGSLVAHLAALPNGGLFAFGDALADYLRALGQRDVAERAFGRVLDCYRCEAAAVRGGVAIEAAAGAGDIIGPYLLL